MTEIRLETRALSRNFGALAAVQRIDFKIGAGARHALIGPNGAGKTTFINLLTGVLRPTDGQVLLGGYGRLYGAILGAIAYMALSHFLAKLYPTAWQLGLGLLLVLIALFARNGMLGLWDQLRNQVLERLHRKRGMS